MKNNIFENEGKWETSDIGRTSSWLLGDLWSHLCGAIYVEMQLLN